MKIKTNELTVTALDWAVGHVLGFTDDESLALRVGPNEEEDPWHPSTNWSQGGPIVEREGIMIYRAEEPDAPYPQPGFAWWANPSKGAFNHKYDDAIGSFTIFEPICSWPGPTPLIAAMRCYVASKLGDAVEIPEGL